MTGKIKSKWVNAFKNVKGQQGQQNNQPGAGQPYDKAARINKQKEQINKHKELLNKQKEAQLNQQKEQLNQRKQKNAWHGIQTPLFVARVFMQEVVQCRAAETPFLSFVVFDFDCFI